jgi:hypothetical protein
LGGVKLLLAVALVVTPSALAACGGDDGDESATTTGAETGTTAEEGGESILIKTHVDAQDPEEMTTGEVLPASTIGDSAFCRGGTFRDAAVEAAGEPITRAFRCPGGNLTMSFSPTGSGRTQSGDWEVVRGDGDFEGLSGGGRMKVTFESGPHPEGRETFTGTVTP